MAHQSSVMRAAVTRLTPETYPAPEPEIQKLQKQVDKLLEEYRQEEIPKYKEPEGDPSF